MFSDLPQTILDELCKQYDLDSLDREIIQLYLSMSEFERGILKKYIRELSEGIGSIDDK